MTAQEFKAMRKKMKMTQAQIATHLGVTQEMISQIENGVRPVPDAIAKKLNKPSKKGMF